MSTITTERVNTTELRTGDVLHHHGMRLRLLDVRHDVPHAGAGTVTVAKGLVTNLAEVQEAGLVPMSWLFDGTAAHSPMWTVQGNDLAHWHREAR